MSIDNKIDIRMHICPGRNFYMIRQMFGFEDHYIYQLGNQFYSICQDSNNLCHNCYMMIDLYQSMYQPYNPYMMWWMFYFQDYYIYQLGNQFYSSLQDSNTLRHNCYRKIAQNQYRYQMHRVFDVLYF